MTGDEQKAVVQYLEYLLISRLVDPIFEKHINDADVKSACYATLYDILDDLDITMDIFGVKYDSVDTDTKKS